MAELRLLMIRREGMGNTVLPVGDSPLRPFENTDIPLFEMPVGKPVFIVFRNPQRNRL